MRTVSAALLAHLQSENPTLAYCVLVTRRDGNVLGFTTSCDPLTVGGVPYNPLGSFDSTAMKQTADTGVDNLDILGVLSSPLITDDDLRAGRYDGAEVKMQVVNFNDLTMGSCLLLRGHIGEVTINDGAYVAELRSLTQYLMQQIGDITSATCRVRNLGDAQCKFNAASVRTSSALTAASADGITLTFGGNAQASGYYDYGMITFTGGANAGISREVKMSTQAGGMQIVLHETLPFPLATGDAATLEAGCDRTWAMCQAKFSNSLNFQGEPHIPGNDQLIQIGRPPGQ